MASWPTLAPRPQLPSSRPPAANSQITTTYDEAGRGSKVDLNYYFVVLSFASCLPANCLGSGILHSPRDSPNIDPQRVPRIQAGRAPSHRIFSPSTPSRVLGSKSRRHRGSALGTGHAAVSAYDDILNLTIAFGLRDRRCFSPEHLRALALRAPTSCLHHGPG